MVQESDSELTDPQLVQVQEIVQAINLEVMDTRKLGGSTATAQFGDLEKQVVDAVLQQVGDPPFNAKYDEEKGRFTVAWIPGKHPHDEEE